MQNLFRLDTVTFTNYRLFKELRLELHPTLTVLHAENAGGKTAALTGVTVAIGSAFKYPQGNLLPTDVHATIDGDGFTRRTAYPCRVAALGLVLGTSMEWSRELAGPNKKTNNVDVKEVRDRLDGLWQREDVDWPVLAAYGTQRLQGVVSNTSKKRGHSVRDDGYTDALDPRSKENQLLDWLFRATMWRLQQGSAPPELEALERALVSALPPEVTRGVSRVDYDVANNEPVIRHQDGSLTPWAQLSDGYHVFLGMVADLARRCATINPHHGADAAERAQGTVVIDEIDLHLHPRWQREALAGLQRAFPRLQFVVSTHSPQVLASVANDQVRTLSNGRLVASAPVQGRDSNSILRESFNTPERPESSNQEALLAKFNEALEREQLEKARALLGQLREAWGDLAPEVVEGAALLRAAEG